MADLRITVSAQELTGPFVATLITKETPAERKCTECEGGTTKTVINVFTHDKDDPTAFVDNKNLHVCSECGVIDIVRS